MIASPAHRLPAKRQFDPLQRLALEAFAKHVGPVGDEAAIRRPQRRDGDAGLCQNIGPAAVRTEPRPACAAERQDHGIGMERAIAPFGRIEQDIAMLVPADPMVPQLEFDAAVAEPPQPGAQQRRSLERFREHAAARSDERVLAQALAPGANRSRRERLDRGAQMRHRRAVAREEAVEFFAMGEVEPAAAGQQEFSADRRHAVINGDTRAALGQHLGRHQAGGAGPDHGNLEISHSGKV